MASGRGRYIPPRDYSLEDVIRPAFDETDEKFLSTQVAGLLTEKLKDINAHDYEAIDRHKRAILDKLAKEYDEVEGIRFGGSHSRSTDVAGLSDVDVLVTIGNFREGMSSEKVIAQFAHALQERFPRTKVDPGKMAVTVRFSDGVEVQVLPAFRHRDGYRVSDPKGSGWITTFPKRFARRLTAVNQKQSGNVIPVIKLAREMCKARNIDVESYHLENLALHAFRYYAGPRTLPKMLGHFFQQAKSLCQKPIKDLSGQSNYVDERLSTSSRQALTKGFRAVECDITSAMASTSLEPWTKLFGQ